MRPFIVYRTLKVESIFLVSLQKNKINIPIYTLQVVQATILFMLRFNIHAWIILYII